MNFEHHSASKGSGAPQEEGHPKKKKQQRNKKKTLNCPTDGNGDVFSEVVTGKDTAQVLLSTEPVNVPAPSQSVLTATSVPVSSPSESGWHMDAGPSHTNGWDDPVEGWEYHQAYLGPYPEANNGKTLVDDTLSDAGWEKVVKVRGKGSPVERRDGGPPNVGRGGGKSWAARQERSRRNGGGGGGGGEGGGGGGGGRGGQDGNGRKFNNGRGGGGGGSSSPALRAQAWGPNARAHPEVANAKHLAQTVHGGLKTTNTWDSGNSQGPPAVFADNGWQNMGEYRNNGSETSSRSGPGWHQGARAASERSSGSGGNRLQQVENGKEVVDYPASTHSDSQCSDLDNVDDDSDDAFLSDGSETVQSHEDQKKSKCFRDFFQDLESMSDSQISEHDRQWHCPACKGGPGAIDWFRGLGPLATHARTMRSRRVKLHRTFADVLEEELRLRRTGASSGGMQGQSTFGKWKGIHDDNDVASVQMIVWPPIIVIQNTQLEQDEQGKWIGMGNKELLDMFQEYKPLKPRHAYGPQGHRGMSLLIFADTPVGYHDACRLEKLFIGSRRAREDWHRPSKLLFRPGGNRILYGYMAVKDDLDIFNRHSKGKTMVKYEVKNVQEVVIEPMQRMDLKQVQSLESKVEREKEASKTFQNSLHTVSKNLQLREQELQVIRQRGEEQLTRNKQQQADLEEFYQQRSAHLADKVAKKEAELRQLRAEFDKSHLYRCQQLEAHRAKVPNDQEQQAIMDQEIAKKTEKVEGSLLNAQDFEQKLREMEQKQHEERIEFQKQQHESALAFEQKLTAERADFLEKSKQQLRH